MNLHVTVERRNPKMLHTVSLQLAQALKTEKADRSSFSHGGKDQPSSCPQDMLLHVDLEGVWLLLWLRALFLLPLSLWEWEGPGSPLIDFEQMPQDVLLAGLRIGLGTPQELVARRVTAGHLLIFQVPLLNPLGSALLGSHRYSAPSRGIRPCCSGFPRSPSWAQLPSRRIMLRTTTRRLALGMLCPSLTSPLQARPRVGTSV